MNHSRASQRGFSLVELMVVVAIIGVLASIAIPSVSKYIAKARQTEAKTNLASLYTSEKAFYAEYTAYDTRFGAIGYSPEGKLRYNVGFAGAGTPDAGPTNGYNTVPTGIGLAINTVAYCGTGGVIAAGVGTPGCTVLNGATNVAQGGGPAPGGPGTSLSGTAFRGGASAIIHTNGIVDGWTIDQNKELLNPTPGIQ